MEQWQIVKKITEILKDRICNLDRCGHFYDLLEKNIIEDLSCYFGSDLLLENAHKLLNVLEKNQKMNKYVLLNKPTCLFTCPVCGDKLGIETNGKEIRFTSECKYPNGLEYAFELNVPSGKMVVENDLRELFPIGGCFYVNVTKECMRTSKAYEKVGLAHAFIGNTCPGLYKINEKNYFIGQAEGKQTNEVAGICTNIWWYSIADFDEYKKRGGSTENIQIVDVKPGVYRFNHIYHLHSGKKDVFTKIKWIHKPDKIHDYIGDYKSKNFTAGQIIHQKMASYPSLFPKDIDVVNHILCVIGSGGEWHKNGFITYDPDISENEPEVEIPIFIKEYKWYPVCSYSKICSIAGVIEKGYEYLDDLVIPEPNESFLSLAFNVAQNLARFGATSYPSNTKEYKKVCARQKKIGKKILKSLLEKYKNRIPEWYKEFSEKDLLLAKEFTCVE